MTSILTVWSRPAAVRKRPDFTIFLKRRSLATSQRTLTAGPLPEPGVAPRVGVTRVQITTERGRGSPEATPCWKTSCLALRSAAAVLGAAVLGAAVLGAAYVVAPTVPAAATPAPVAITVRRPTPASGRAVAEVLSRGVTPH